MEPKFKVTTKEKSGREVTTCYVNKEVAVSAAKSLLKIDMVESVTITKI